MADIRVGTWNAFGDESLSPERLHGALEVIKSMDADVLAIQEMALHGAHQPSLINERLEEVTARMAEQGYAGITLPATPHLKMNATPTLCHSGAGLAASTSSQYEPTADVTG